nr:putative reverse transcriptase domain-containing protein [Tanacetum cinerariifolium]
LIQETIEKIVQIKQGMQAARDRRKSYADLKRKPIEFQVGDKVLERIGDVAYKLDLPEELSRVHNTFHVSNLKKCHADKPLVVPLDGLHFDDKLQFVEEPVEIVDRKPICAKISDDEEKASDRSSRRNMMMYLKNTVGFRMDYFKGMSYDDIRPIFEAKFNSNIEFLLKSKEQMEEEANRAIASINETLAQKAAKRRRLNIEAEDVEELKQHLEIVPDEDDDVYTEATPLARKDPVVDYHIILVNNKPRYKIIKADGTHQLYASFITMLKNFDRDDLVTLWSIVKERFSTSKPNNFSNEYLLTTLKKMFGRPDG